MRTKILKIYGGVLVLGIVYFIAVMLFDAGIPCFYKYTMGFYCPGCGTTDMLVAFSKFKIKQAFFCNPLVFTLSVVWTAVAVAYFIKNRCSKNDKRFLTVLIIFSVISAIAFTVVRNLY